jgi:hypothetical protein
MAKKIILTDKLELKVVASITHGGKAFPEINLTVMGNGLKQTPMSSQPSLGVMKPTQRPAQIAPDHSSGCL